LATAPNCDVVIAPVVAAAGATGTNGLISDYDGLECTTKWDACITAETNDTPRGCLCLVSTSTASGFEWQCGSTNNWFGRETAV
jgi:hypothetical protein